MGIALNMQLVALLGLAIGTAIVLGVTYLSVRKQQGHLSAEAFRALYLQTLARVGGWSVASYLVWFILISPSLSHLGVHIPRPKG